jgi:uncharacterized protein YjbI with pentapeptide repeats
MSDSKANYRHILTFIEIAMLEEKTGNQDIKNTLGWSLLELLIVPLFLTGLSFYLNSSITNREKMKEYLKDITELASKATEKPSKKYSEPQLKNIPTLRTLARARTLTILRESNEKSKREIIEFLANSDLQHQISLKSADLHSVDLSGLYLKDAHLSKANLKNANLSGSILQGVNLKGANLDGANLSNIKYDKCTIVDDTIESRIIELNWVKILRKENCHNDEEKDKVELD